MSPPLLVGLALAVGCLVYVLYPLVGPALRRERSAPLPAPGAMPAGREVTDEEIEAAIRSYRATRLGSAACPVCGPRPEPDALYCSACGRRLGGELT